MRISSFLAAAVFAATFSSATAQSVTTAPVGAISINVNANSDQRIGITMLRPSLYASVVEGTPTTTLTVSGTIPSLGNEVKYIRFTSGNAEGMWFQLTASSSTTLTFAENLEDYNVLEGDKFEIRPFWTLSTLFPQGSGVVGSTNPYSPQGFILLNNPQAVGVNLSAPNAYFYYSGTQAQKAWYNNDGTFANADNVVISPETSIIIRNSTAQAFNVMTVGDVPVTAVANTVVARSGNAQDNIIYNPYPAVITLGQSGLVASQAVRGSTNPYSPVDLVLVYPSTSTAKNASASSVYFYYSGEQAPNGWYNNDGSFSASDNVELPPGAAFIIRKASGGDQVVEWVPNVPYSLL